MLLGQRSSSLLNGGRSGDRMGVDSRYDCPPGRAIEPAGQPRPGRVSLQKSKEQWEITHCSVRHGMRRIERGALGKIEVGDSRKIRTSRFLRGEVKGPSEPGQGGGPMTVMNRQPPPPSPSRYNAPVRSTHHSHNIQFRYTSVLTILYIT